MVFAGQDAWRKHPLLYQNYKRPLPGFGIALGIFGAYLGLDYIFGKLTSMFSMHFLFF